MCSYRASVMTRKVGPTPPLAVQINISSVPRLSCKIFHTLRFLSSKHIWSGPTLRSGPIKTVTKLHAWSLITLYTPRILFSKHIWVRFTVRRGSGNAFKAFTVVSLPPSADRRWESKLTFAYRWPILSPRRVRRSQNGMSMAVSLSLLSI